MGPSGFDFQLQLDLFRASQAVLSAGGKVETVLDIPLFSVYGRFESLVLNLEKVGVRALVDQEPTVEVLREVMVNPLKESSWGLSRRQRSIRGWSRLSRACREAGEAMWEAQRVDTP